MNSSFLKNGPSDNLRRRNRNSFTSLTAPPLEIQIPTPAQWPSSNLSPISASSPVPSHAYSQSSSPSSVGTLVSSPSASPSSASYSTSKKHSCHNCHQTETPLWRKGEGGQILCNKCGLYQQRHSKARPLNAMSKKTGGSWKKKKKPAGQGASEKKKIAPSKKNDMMSDDEDDEEGEDEEDDSEESSPKDLPRTATPTHGSPVPKNEVDMHLGSESSQAAQAVAGNSEIGAVADKKRKLAAKQKPAKKTAERAESISCASLPVSYERALRPRRASAPSSSVPVPDPAAAASTVISSLLSPVTFEAANSDIPFRSPAQNQLLTSASSPSSALFAKQSPFASQAASWATLTEQHQHQQQQLMQKTEAELDPEQQQAVPKAGASSSSSVANPQPMLSPSFSQTSLSALLPSPLHAPVEERRKQKGGARQGSGRKRGSGMAAIFGTPTRGRGGLSRRGSAESAGSSGGSRRQSVSSVESDSAQQEFEHFSLQSHSHPIGTGLMQGAGPSAALRRLPPFQSLAKLAGYSQHQYQSQYQYAQSITSPPSSSSSSSFSSLVSSPFFSSPAAMQHPPLYSNPAPIVASASSNNSTSSSTDHNAPFRLDSSPAIDPIASFLVMTSPDQSFVPSFRTPPFPCSPGCSIDGYSSLLDSSEGSSFLSSAAASIPSSSISAPSSTSITPTSSACAAAPSFTFSFPPQSSSLLSLSSSSIPAYPQHQYSSLQNHANTYSSSLLHQEQASKATSVSLSSLPPPLLVPMVSDPLAFSTSHHHF